MNNFTLWLKDTAERVAITFVIAVLTFITAEGLTDFNTDTGKKLMAAGLVAAAVAIKQIVIPPDLGVTLFQDVLVRATWSGVQHMAVAATASAGFEWFSITAWQNVAVGAIAAVVSVVKGVILARVVDNSVTPASLAPVASGDTVRNVVVADGP